MEIGDVIVLNGRRYIVQSVSDELPPLDWPNCDVPDCPNASCLKLGSKKCWPHTVGAPFDTSKLSKEVRMEFERKWLEKRATE